MVNTLRTINQKNCPICKSQGNVLYKDLSDKLFGTPGKWNFMECVNKSCDVIWLNPMPAEEDLKIAYSNYYTHMSNAGTGGLNKAETGIERINNEYLKYKFSPNAQKFRFVFSVLKFIYRLHPLKRTVNDLNEIYFSQKKQGKLLDVGCGSGEFLIKMRELGWSTIGVDFDEEALKVAKQKNLEVYPCNSKKLKFRDNSFDLITLNNVFEHLYNPNDILSEIFRTLKTGGSLVIITPNKKSFSHKLFRENWRGLEPPRHLHLMTRGSLNNYLSDVGFINAKSFCRVISYYIFESSYLLKKNKKKLNVFEKYLFRLVINFYAILSFFKKDLGDLIYIVMSK